MSDKLARAIYLTIATLATLVVIVLFVAFLFRFEPGSPIITLNNGWKVEIQDGKTYENVSIDDIRTDVKETLKRGQKLTLTRTIPPAVRNYVTPCIRLRVNYSAVDVFLEDGRILSMEKNKLVRGKFIGSYDNYIDLPNVKPGDEFRIEYFISEDDILPDIVAPELGYYMDLQLMFLRKYNYPLICGVFLCIFGLFFLILSLILAPVLPEAMGQLVSSILCLVSGTWVLTTHNLSPVFFHTGHTTDVEYVCFFMLVPLMYLLLWFIHPPKRKKIFAMLSIASTLIVAALYVLHFTDTAHMSETRPVFFALALIVVGVVAYDVIQDIKERRFDITNVMQMMGPALFCLCGTIAMVSYMVVGYMTHQSPSDVMLLFFTTGCSMFSTTSLLLYFLLLSETDNRRKAFRQLNQKAYVDPTTGAFNLNYYEETAAKLDSARSGFAILAMDLGGLNMTNELKGHGAGDRLLKAFGNAATIDAPDNASAYRLGNDKFAIIMKDNKRGPLEAVVQKIKKAMLILDYNEPDLPHQVFFGIAYSDEVQDPTTEKVLALAKTRLQRSSS